MLKLYRSKFTPKELRVLATHCLDFCFHTVYSGRCHHTACEYRAVCRDLARLARYADKLAAELESTNPQNGESAHC